MAVKSIHRRSSCVNVHAVSCGHFTLPEHQFVKPSTLEARRTVPSLAFLIQHKDNSGRTTRILFDLGLRRDLKRYPTPIQRHTENRRPITTGPDVVRRLARGRLRPDGIDYVVYSHHDLLPEGRSIELSDPLDDKIYAHDSNSEPATPSFSVPWRLHPTFNLPDTLDIFSDGSVLIVNAQGHLPGYINLFTRTSEQRYMYLSGDVCHDWRLLTGEKQIGDWTDAEGHVCCIHVDREAAETIRRIRRLEDRGVEVVFADDVEWENDPKNSSRFFGAG
ncbi:uncharacterized protein M421DRAFT_408843 [Didymella exigua CBS 183.55]|uniref:Metallo-beta-lactamase domain-containing protein n=1 Tax=Didymella exigua CBS 183.55 TaxID=1150837 RepID=A0A6A5RVA2_9PLEO|nr:uncharacterized protein M421DRAFT_408843 [Didymella exigua CBS 183.55]KAF1931290.1 hypothetical protein M421DRAFT_408843 [Didymella exigua CBS 183.55]